MVTVAEFWNEFINKPGNSKYANHQFTSWYFCNTEECANELLTLVLSGVKRATAGALWSYEYTKEPIPKSGELSVITNWQGEANCIIRTISVETLPFREITAEFAQKEGEGDKSLKYWREVHWDYFKKELSQYDRIPTLDMPVVCEEFELIYTAGS